MSDWTYCQVPPKLRHLSTISILRTVFVSSQKILLVEDEDLLRYSLQQLLLSSGYEVTGFSSGKAVLDLLQSNASPADWALVIMDVHLDGDNGLEVQKTMRDLGVHTPFVFMSAHQNAHDVNQAWRDGAHNFLFKPFTPDELLGGLKSEVQHPHRG